MVTSSQHKRAASPSLTAVAAWLLLAVGLGACGRAVEKGDARSRRGADLKVSPLSVRGTLKDGTATSARLHSLKTVYLIEQAPGAEAPRVRLSVIDGQGRVILDEVKQGREIDWAVAFEGDEGLHHLTAEVVTAKGDLLRQTYMPWEANVDLDVTQPDVVVDGVIRVDPATGNRTFSAKATVTGEKWATCDGARLRPLNPEKALALTLAADDGASADVRGPARPLGFGASVAAIGDDMAGPFVLDIACRDLAGNTVQLAQPVGVERLDYGLVAEVASGQAVPTEGGSATFFVHPGQAPLKLRLLEKATGQELAPKAVDWEKPLLRMYVTEEAPTSAAALGQLAEPLWTQSFESEVLFRVPADYDGRRQVYVSAVRRDPASGAESLVGVVTLPLYVDETPPTGRWTSKPRFVPAAKDAALTAQLAVTSQGAPLDGKPTLEQSTDGLTWTPLAATVTLENTTAGQSTFTVSAKYPFADERPFHVRARVADKAGNTLVTAASHALVGRPGLAPAVAAPDAGCAAKSKLTTYLATAQLCRLAGVDGQLGASRHAQVLIQNRGGAALHLAPTPGLMGYRVLVNGVEADAGHVNPSTDFLLNPLATRLFLFEVNPAWLDADKVEVEWDREATLANSTDNACYAAGTYPRLVLQDKGAGLRLADVPFACDPAQAYVP